MKQVRLNPVSALIIVIGVTVGITVSIVRALWAHYKT